MGYLGRGDLQDKNGLFNQQGRYGSEKEKKENGKESSPEGAGPVKEEETPHPKSDCREDHERQTVILDELFSLIQADKIEYDAENGNGRTIQNRILWY